MMLAMDKDEHNRVIRAYRENGEILSQAIAVQAPLIRVKFNALVKEGFSESQAIELCKGPLLQ